MKRNRKIDDLFKEKIPKGEQVPPSDIWENISSRLSEDDKKRPLVVPIWFKIAGVAAVIILAFTFFQEFYKPMINSPSVVDEPSSTKEFKSSGDSGKDFLEGGTSESVPEIVIGEVEKSNEQDIKEKEFLSKPTKDTSRLKMRSLSLDTSLKAEKIYSSSLLFASTGDLTTHQSQTIQQNQRESDKDRESEGANDEKAQERPIEDRFSAAPTVAAVYFGEMGNGNALDDKFSNNSNPKKLSIGYGLSLGYQMSEKVKIRSGINKISLKSQTLNVDNTSAVNSKAIDGNPAGSLVIPEGNGTLNHEFGFLEIPLEVEYTLVDKRLGLNFIVGASTFFLQNNQVLLESHTFTADLGPSNNINRMSYSANLGLGLKFDFTPWLHLNLDPIFKYQFNTYKGVNNLRPYHFGVYSGVRVKF